jgi:hypothetical protein
LERQTLSGFLLRLVSLVAEFSGRFLPHHSSISIALFRKQPDSGAEATTQQ